VNGCGDSMGKVKIPYYTAIAGRGYWRPTAKMRALGFQIIRCGTDGPDAWALAHEWNKRWQAIRRGEAPPLVNIDQLSRDQAEAARRYPPGSIGSAFQVYIRTLGNELGVADKVYGAASHKDGVAGGGA
jgi:hypothetical protein